MANIFIDLFNMSITASYLVLAVVVARLLLKKAPKWINCLLWALVGIRLICPFSFESALSLIPSSQTISVNNTSTGRPFTVQSGVPVVDSNINEILGEKYYEGVTVPANTFADMTNVLAIVWIVGLFAMLLYGSISYLRLHKKVGASILLNNNIYYCDNIDTPFILGFFKPKIYVPSGITDEQISYIALHEKAHLKRKDHWWKPLGFILLSVYWFNPIMWVAYILLCRDIETACDEKVIKNMPNTEKKGYSETLVSCSVQRRMVMACPLAFGEVGVKQRIKSVLNYKKPAFWMIIFAVLLVAVVIACFLTNPDGNSSSIGIIGGADGPTSILVSRKKDVVDKILSEDGYKLVSVEEKKIIFDFMSSVLTDKMFEKDGSYRVRSKYTMHDSTIFSLKKVTSHDDYFAFDFDVSYENIPEKGTIYIVNTSQLDGGLELGDEIRVSDPFGEIGSVGCTTYCTSLGPKREFSLQVPKEWFKDKRNNKITVSFNAWAVEFQEEGYKDEAEDKNYTYATSNTGAFYKIGEHYYFAAISKNAEYKENGLFFVESDGDKRLVCVLGGEFIDYFSIDNSFYYIQNDYRLYSVELKEDAQPHLVAEKLYQQENTYSIEKIISRDKEYIYCQAKLYGVREEYPDWDLVYLRINRKTEEFSKIPESDIPVSEYQFDDILDNIKTTVDVDYHNIYVRSYRVRYTKSGKIDSVILNVWVPSDEYDRDKPGTVGNILVADDYSAFFNVINEGVSLNDFCAESNEPTLSLYEVMSNAEESIQQNLKKIDKNDKSQYYILSSKNAENFFVSAEDTTEPYSEKTQNNKIEEVPPPQTTAYIDYFTPDGERVIEYVGGPW